MGAPTELLREDIRIEMPPYPMWFSGLGPVCAFLEPHVRPGRWRSTPATVNGEPGMATYVCRDDGLFRAHSLQVLTITKTGIAEITAFQEPDLFGVFGLPPTVS